MEVDLNNKLVDKIHIQRDDDINFLQPIICNHLPNACFHCRIQGHLIKDCPRKALQIEEQKNAQLEEHEPSSLTPIPSRKNNNAELNRFDLLEGLCDMEEKEEEKKSNTKCISSFIPIKLETLTQEVNEMDASIDLGSGDESLNSTPIKSQQDNKKYVESGSTFFFIGEVEGPSPLPTLELAIRISCKPGTRETLHHKNTH